MIFTTSSFTSCAKIDVDVRQLVQRHAFLVEEAAEIQIETNRTHATDPKAIADQAVRRAAAGDPVNVLPATLLQKIPRDQEVFLVTDVVDDAEFLHRLRLVLPGPGTVALTADLSTPTGARIHWAGTVRRLVGRKLWFAEGHFEVAALSDFMREAQPIGIVLAGLSHVRRVNESAAVRSFVSPDVPPAATSACGCFARCRISGGRRGRHSESRTGHGLRI
jgi:hypothetical protein